MPITSRAMASEPVPMHRRVDVLPGPGIVGRFGEVLVWFEEGEERSPAVVAGVLDVARSLAEGGEDAQAGPRLAEVLRGEPLAVPALVLVVPTEDGLRAVVHGWGRVLAEDVDIDGGWADRTLAWTTSLAAGRGGDVLRLPTPGGVHDLRRGTSPGGGLAVTLGARAEVPGPASPPAGAEPDGPAPDATPPPLAPAAPAGGAGVKGVVCTQGHFNNPTARSCETCGVSMSQGTRILTDGIRPSLGTLVLDDGTAFELDASHVIGSDPGSDASVAAGDADPIVIVDPTGRVAPVHAEVRLVGWEVVLVPREDTFVRLPGFQRWAPARLDEPVPLPVGTSVSIGPRAFSIHADAGPGGE